MTTTNPTSSISIMANATPENIRTSISSFFDEGQSQVAIAVVFETPPENYEALQFVCVPSSFAIANYAAFAAQEPFFSMIVKMISPKEDPAEYKIRNIHVFSAKAYEETEDAHKRLITGA